MQMQSTYWLEKVLKMISLYVNALLCTLQHIVIHAMQVRIDTAELHPRPTPTLVYETAGRLLVRHSVLCPFKTNLSQLKTQTHARTHTQTHARARFPH